MILKAAFKKKAATAECISSHQKCSSKCEHQGSRGAQDESSMHIDGSYRKLQALEHSVAKRSSHVYQLSLTQRVWSKLLELH